MRAIKQKDEEYSKYVPSVESLMDKLLYNPLYQKRWKEKMENGYYYRLLKGFLPIFEKFSGAKLEDFDLFYIAQSHLDAAWLFPVVDAKIRAFKTFYKAIEHIEKYPQFFTFSQTTPQYYNWIKNYDKNLWRKVKHYVKEGRFEPVGGMWVEPTLDECWGEALVRQRLYGQLYYLREFGKTSKVESLLDVFGFPHSLPQILKKSGAEAFWTTKCTWNDQNPWPMANYMWRGVDGTEIFTHQYKFQYMALSDLGLYKKTAKLPKPEKNHEVLSSRNTNQEIEDCFAEDPEKRIKTLGIFYGWGDGARGPHEVEIGLHQLLAQLGHGKFTTMHNYFEYLRKQVGDNYLIWDDEMYLEFHRGCKTTQLEVKNYNRKSEIWAFASETLATLINLSNLTEEEVPDEFKFKKAEIFEIWRKILFNQFHDILPGSSIPEVYKLAVKEQKESMNKSKRIITSILRNIKIKTGEKEGTSKSEESLPKPSHITVFNPFMWERSEYISDKGDVYYLEDIPPVSINQIDLQGKLIPEKELNQVIQEISNNYILENSTIRAKIDKDSGTLTSLFYKPMQTDMITIGGTYNNQGAGLRVYHEKVVQYDAWNIDPSYPRKNVDVWVKREPHITIAENGAPCIVTHYEFLKSTATVKYQLLPEDNMVRIKIHTNIHDAKIMIKYFIPTTLESQWVSSEIPYAFIKRSRKPSSEMEKAKWEMPMQKWLDISDDTHGMTILNNNRYGFNATGRGVYITLQRTAKYPKPGYFSTFRLIPKSERPKYTDLMPFNFKLALLPHAGNEREEKAWKHGYDFNLPLQELYSKEIEGNIGKKTIDILPKKRARKEKEDEEGTNAKNSNNTISFKPLNESLVSSDSQNIIMGALKPPEFTGKDLDELTEHKNWAWDEKAFLVRLVEQSGNDCETTLKFHQKLKIDEVKEVNLLEMEASEPLKINKRSKKMKLEFHKFEIKTLLIILK